MLLLSEIAAHVDGRLVGRGDFEVHALMSLGTATGDALTFCVHAPGRTVLDTQAGAILVSPELAERFSINRIITNDPYLAYAKASQLFRNPPVACSGMASSAVVSGDAQVGEHFAAGAGSVIGSGVRIGCCVTLGNHVSVGQDATIGDHTVIGDHVTVNRDCEIGRNCLISPGAVIGSSGFGYAPDGTRWERIEQLGRVIIRNHVDIGANTTIDRGALEDTVIADGVKIDNLVQVAHNVVIGENTAIAGCAGIAGSTRIGRRCRIGGRASILGHLEIADDVTIMANSLVTGSIREKGEYGSMIPVQPAKVWRKNLAWLRKLDRVIGKLVYWKGTAALQTLSSDNESDPKH